MKAKDFDKIFDENKEDIIDYLDLSTLRRAVIQNLLRNQYRFSNMDGKKIDEEAKILQ